MPVFDLCSVYVCVCVCVHFLQGLGLVISFAMHVFDMCIARVRVHACVCVCLLWGQGLVTSFNIPVFDMCSVCVCYRVWGWWYPSHCLCLTCVVYVCIICVCVLQGLGLVISCSLPVFDLYVCVCIICVCVLQGLGLVISFAMPVFDPRTNETVVRWHCCSLCWAASASLVLASW